MSYISKFTPLELAALGVLSFVVLFTIFMLVKICSLPYDIARKRNHKHQEAILVAGWVSLFTLHAIWPFLWIWAMLDGTPEKES